MPDLRLAAWLRWMTPLEAALSSLRAAERCAWTAASLSPLAAAARTFFTAVFTSDFTAWLRRRRFSLVRLRFFWDLMFATWYSLRLLCDDRTAWCALHGTTTTEVFSGVGHHGDPPSAPQGEGP